MRHTRATAITVNGRNWNAFAALAADGSIASWGSSSYGGSGAPSGTGFTKVFDSRGLCRVACRRLDRLVGSERGGLLGAPSGSGFTDISSTPERLCRVARRRLDRRRGVSISSGGSYTSGLAGRLIHAWTCAPSGGGFTKVFSNAHAFAALRTDGSIVSWGGYGGSSPPLLLTAAHCLAAASPTVFSTRYAFAALHADGSIASWGRSCVRR